MNVRQEFTWSVLVLAAALALGLLSGPAHTQERAPTGQAATDDARFAKEAAQGAIAEIRAGNMAQQKGQSEAVKDFGRQLARDHAQSLEKLRPLAAGEGVEIPSEPAPAQREAAERLSRLSGPAFDRQFASQMVRDHEQEIRKFEQQASGNDELARYARESLPVLREHLEIARSLAEPGQR